MPLEIWSNGSSVASNNFVVLLRDTTSYPNVFHHLLRSPPLSSGPADCQQALVGWQAFETARLDVQRAAIEQSLAQLAMPLAEHATLLRAQDEQRKDAARAMSLSEPLTHLRDLLNALSFEPGDGVVVQQLRQREHETELLATSRGHIASAEWLKRLSAVRGVKEAEVSDLHRSAPRSGAVTAASVTGPIEFGAHLRWDDLPKKTAHTSDLAARRPMKSEQSGGAK